MKLFFFFVAVVFVAVLPVSAGAEIQKEDTRSESVQKHLRPEQGEAPARTLAISKLNKGVCGRYNENHCDNIKKKLSEVQEDSDRCDECNGAPPSPSPSPPSPSPTDEAQCIVPLPEFPLPRMDFQLNSSFLVEQTGHILGTKTDDEGREYVFIRNPDGREIISTPYNDTGLDFEPFFILGINVFQLADLVRDTRGAQREYLISNVASVQAGLLWQEGALNNTDVPQELRPLFHELSQHLNFFQSVSGQNRGFDGTEWKANGCTGVPDISPAIKACCDAHDECYCKGGTDTDRLACDKAFRDCIRKESAIIADIYYLGVRAFGSFFFNYVTPNETETIPVLPECDEKNPCTYEVTLINVFYGGDNIGNDWKYTVQVQAGKQVSFPEHTVNHKTNDGNPKNTDGNNKVGSGKTTCNEPVNLAIFVTAIEVDFASDDPGSSNTFLKFVCDGKVYNKKIVVKVEEGAIFIDLAVMEFTFQITTKC